MPWNYDDEEINGIVDANLKDSPPNPPAVNTAASIRNMLKTFWSAIRGQVSSAVDYIDQDFAFQVGEMLETVETRVSAAEAKADSVYATFELRKQLGTYNAATGIATKKPSGTSSVLVALPPVGSKGEYYDCTYPGTNNITGESIEWNNGDIIVSAETAWYRIPKGDLALSKATALEHNTQGMYANDEPGVLEICDEEGYVLCRFDLDGLEAVFKNFDLADILARLTALEEILGVLSYFSLDDHGALTFPDQDGNVLMKLSSAGVEYFDQVTKADLARTLQIPTQLLSDYFQIIIDGQSLSVSGNVVQAVDFYDAKTFTGGILTNYDPDTAGAANTYFGSDLIALPTSGVETPGKALAKIMKELIRDENGITIDSQYFTPVVNSCGTSGAGYAQLSNAAGDEYRRLLESVRRGKDFALAAGKTYNVPILCYIQGENTTDRVSSISVWYSMLETLFNSLNTDIKAITGQTNDVQFITYQIASDMARGTGVPLAQLKLAKEKSNVHFGCSMYQMEYADLLHVTSASYRIMGAMMGVVAKRAIVDGVKMEPISILSHNVQKNEAGTVWAIKCKMQVPVKPLVFDETVNARYATAPAHKGFIIKNGSNVDIVTGVSISHGDTINIFCSENPAGLTLSYAIGGRDNGGNLRDSQGDKITISCEGVNKRVDNWCPMFEKVI